MFCEKCGTQLAGNEKFCTNCGAVRSGGGYAPAQPPYIPRLVGFSQRIHDPVFEKLRKSRFRKSLIICLISLPVIILLFQIVPFFVDSFTRTTALIVGCIVGGFGLIWTLAGGAKRAAAGTWDGEVIDKKINVRHDTDQNGNTDTSYYHAIIFRLASGGRKKMQRKLRTGSFSAWDMMVYLNIGDRVRYHGKLDYYEKYDKSRDAEVPCANCHIFIDIRFDTCPNCHVPVIKP